MSAQLRALKAEEAYQIKGRLLVRETCRSWPIGKFESADREPEGQGNAIFARKPCPCDSQSCIAVVVAGAEVHGDYFPNKARGSTRFGLFVAVLQYPELGAAGSDAHFLVIPFDRGRVFVDADRSNG